jgi:thiol-disulfide isomerase/thioredoxin
VRRPPGHIPVTRLLELFGSASTAIANRSRHAATLPAAGPKRQAEVRRIWRWRNVSSRSDQEDGLLSTDSGALTGGRRPTRTLFCAIFILVAALVGPARAESGGFDLAHYHGKVVVVDFWASWCKPCRQSIPWLNEMHSRYAAQGLVIVGINVDAQRTDADRFMKSTPIDFQVVYDSKGELAQRFELQGMPSSFVFDRDGKLVATHLGFRQAHRGARETTLRQLIDKART